MFEVTLEVNLHGLPRKLRAYSVQIDQELDPFVKRKVYAIRDEAKTYEAPTTPLSKRSGHMSRQTVAFRMGEAAWKTEMRASHSKWVRGSWTRGPAWMHRGRWLEWRTIVQGHMQTVERDLLDLLAAIKRKVGL